MTNRYLSKDMGIMLMDGEKLILETRPTEGFVTLAMVSFAMTIVCIPLLPLVYLFAKLAQSRNRYWLTDRRVVIADGVIGFRVRSIPLERISDVAFSRTLPELLAGVSSIIVRDMTGESEKGKSLVSVANAPEVQRQILEQVQKTNTAALAV